MVKPDRGLGNAETRIEAVGICGGFLRFARAETQEMRCGKDRAGLKKKIMLKQRDAT
jgi:hypothetical protein